MPENSEPSFEEIMQFDPFGGESGTETPPEPTKQEASAPGDETGQEPEVAAEGEAPKPPPPQPTPAPVPPPKPITQEDLVASIRAQTEAIARSMQPQQQVAQQPRPNKFNLGIPDQLLGALRSEDPGEFRNGVGALVNSMANHIWDNFQQAIRDELAPAIRGMISQHQATQNQHDQVSRDFYGTYPQLNNPVLAPMIQTVGAQVAEELSRAGRSVDWNPQLRDEIARRVFSVLTPLQQQMQAQPRASAKRPFSTGNGARPSADANPNSFDEMSRMIFGPS